MSTPAAPLLTKAPPKKGAAHAPKLLSISQAAKLLGLNPMTLRRWEARGLITAIRTLGGKRRYSLQQIADIKSPPTPQIPVLPPAFQHQTPPTFLEQAQAGNASITNKIDQSRTKVAIPGGFLLPLFLFGAVSYFGFSWLKTPESKNILGSNLRTRVLAAATLPSQFTVRIKSLFKDTATFENGIIVSPQATVNGDLTAENLTLSGDIAINGGNLTSTAATFNLLADNTTISVGATTGTTTINHDLKVVGKITGASGVISGALEVGGDSTLKGKADVSGKLKVSSDGEITGKLTLGGNADISGSLEVDGTTNDIAGTLNLSGNKLNSSGDLTINPSGGQILLADGDTLIIGGASAVAYNVIGDNTTNASSNVASDDDLYIEGNLEVDGTLYANISGSVTTGFTQGSVVFADSSGALAEDNTNFYWDDSNNRLGIGDSTPDNALDIESSATGYNFLFGSSGITLSGSGSNNFVMKAGGSLTLSGGSVSNIGSGLIVNSSGTFIGGSSETIGDSGFSMDGNDLFVAGMAGIEGNFYIDGSLTTFASGAAIVPSVDLGGDLGSASQRWNNLYVNSINSNATLSQTGQAIFTYDPGDAGFIESSVLINPTAPETNDTLLGIGQGGYQRAGIDAEGDIILGYNSGVTATSTDNPLTIYGHSSSIIATMETDGDFGLGDSTPDDDLDIEGSSLGYNFLFGTNGVTLSTAGTTGLNFDTFGQLSLTSNQGAANALELISTAGGIDISTGSGTGDIDILSGDALNLKGILGSITLSSGTTNNASGLVISSSGLLVGATSETISDAGFTMDGDDQFIAGMLGVEGNIYTDGTIIGNIQGSVDLNFTQGSVLFADSGGAIAQDNTNFYWDDSNNRLGIGDATPDDALDIESSILGYNFLFGSSGITLSTNGTNGINIDTFGQLSLTGNQGAASAVEIVSTAGGIDISSGSSTGDIDILSGDAINIKASAGNLNLSSGTADTTQSGLVLDTSGNVTLYGRGNGIVAGKINKVITVDGTVYPQTCAGINQAIDDLGASGGEIYLPEATYTCAETVTIDYNNTTIRGAGKGTIIQPAAWASWGTPGHTIDMNGKDYLTFRDFQIDGTNLTGQAFDLINSTTTDNSVFDSLYIYNSDEDGLTVGANNSITNSIFSTNDVTGLILGSTNNRVSNNLFLSNVSYGIYAFNASLQTISSNRFTSNNYGIYVDQSSLWTITGNSFYNNTTTSLIASTQNNGNGWVVANNLFYKDSASGTAISLGSQNATALVVVGNTIRNFTTGIIISQGSGGGSVIADNTFNNVTTPISDSGVNTVIQQPDNFEVQDPNLGLQFTFNSGGITLSTSGTSGINIDTFGSASITSNQGAANAIELIAPAGGIDISTGSGTGDIDILSGDAINLTAVNSGAITISTGGNGGDGGTLSLLSGDDIDIISREGVAQAILIDAREGGIDISTGGNAAGNDIDILSGSSINLSAREGAADAITLVAGQGGIDISTGSGTGDIDILSGDDIFLTALGGTLSMSTVSGLTTASGISINSSGDFLAGNNDLYVDVSTGRVGIGTSSPSYLFDVQSSSSSLFYVTSEQITSAVPHQFTAAGDVSMAYDLQFTNQTASYIKSYAPLYIEAGETFESNDLTLRAYNAGSIILDTEGDGVTGAIQLLSQAGGIDLSTGTGTAGNDIDILSGASVNLHAKENAADAIVIYTIRGGIDISTGSDIGGTSNDIDILGGASVNLSAREGAADAITLVAGQGGIDISTGSATQDIDILSGASINLTAAESAADSIKLTSSAGGIDILATGAAAGEDIDITSTGSSVNISSTEGVEDAITIIASAGGINISTGSGTQDIDILGGDAINIKASAGNLNLSSGTADTTQSGLVLDTTGNVTLYGRNNGLVAGKINKVITVDGTVYPQTCAGINQAIDDLGSSGGEIYLPEATYTCAETVTIDNNNTTIRGSGVGTIIQPVAWGSWTTPGHIINLNGKDNLTLTDFKIDGTNIKGGGQTYDLINGSAVIQSNFTNLILQKSDDMGLDLQAGQQNLISGNYFFDNDDSGLRGLQLTASRIVNNNFESNDIYGAWFQSMAAVADGNAISGNTFRSNVTAGLYIENNHFNGVNSNTFYGGTYGIQLVGALYQNTFSNNTFDTPTNGISTTGGTLVRGNVFDANTFYTGTTGITISTASSDNNVISNNTFFTFTTGISLGSGASNTHISGNKFISVTTNISDSGTNTVIQQDDNFEVQEPNLGLQFTFNSNGITLSTSGTSGFNLDAYGQLSLSTGQGAANAIELISTAGGIDISTGSGTGDIDVLSGDAINLNAVTGSITLSSGTNTTQSGLLVDSTGVYVGEFTAANSTALCWDNDGGSYITDCTGGPTADYAEQYPTEPGIEYGDIVATGSKVVVTEDGQPIVQLVKTQTAYQNNIIGIVSNNYGDFSSTGYNVPASENPMPVALSGRVPVKIDPNSPAIEVGDFLTSSSVPGLAMKAQEPGYVIGKALQTWTPNTGQDTAMVFINLIYYYPNLDLSSLSPVLSPAPLDQAPIASLSARLDALEASMSASPSATLDNLQVDGDITISGTSYMNNLSANGLTTFGTLTIDPEKSSVDSLISPLSLQRSALQPINLQGTKVTIATNGDLEIKEGRLILNDQIRGKAAVKPGQTSVTIDQVWESTPSSILTTPEFDSYAWVSDITNEGFTAHFKTPSLKPSNLNWLAVW